MIQFLSIAFRNMKTVGTICPSSPMLSRELAEAVIEARSPKRVLEVGPGTGPVTKEILKALRAGDVFDIVELSTEFCQDLDSKILDPWRRKGSPARVTLHNAAIQDVELEAGSYDCVVCGLPFNNFEHELVEVIMHRMLELLLLRRQDDEEHGARRARPRQPARHPAARGRAAPLALRHPQGRAREHPARGGAPASQAVTARPP
jgi:phospholipid N-methyltransferase